MCPLPRSTIHIRQKRELLQMTATEPASEQAMLPYCNEKNFENFRPAHIHCISEIMEQRRVWAAKNEALAAQLGDTSVGLQQPVVEIRRTSVVQEACGVHRLPIPYCSRRNSARSRPRGAEWEQCVWR
jgi:hypothetical protein